MQKYYYKFNYNTNIDFQNEQIIAKDGEGAIVLPDFYDEDTVKKKIKWDVFNVSLSNIEIPFTYDNTEFIKQKIKDKQLKYLYEPEFNLFCVLERGYTIYFEKLSGRLIIDNVLDKKNILNILHEIIN
jgi:hypothetical protein